MGKDGVAHVDDEMVCNSCLHFFAGHNRLCPSCGSKSIRRLRAQKSITPSEKLVLDSRHYGYGEL